MDGSKSKATLKFHIEESTETCVDMDTRLPAESKPWDREIRNEPHNSTTSPFPEESYHSPTRHHPGTRGRRRRFPAMNRNCGDVAVRESPSTGTSFSSDHSLSESASMSLMSSSPHLSSTRRNASLSKTGNIASSLGPPGVFISETSYHHRCLESLRRRRSAPGRQSSIFRTRRRVAWHVRDILWCGTLVFMICSALLVGLFIFTFRGRLQTGGLATTFDSRIQPMLSNVTARVDEEGEWVVFYNIFVPFQSFLAGVDHLIIEEQLSQVGQSYANIGSKNGALTVYYTTIGDAIDTEWIKDLCAIKYDMKCKHLHHYRRATETVTLTSLHQHCSANPANSVIYLHNKGSLHPKVKGQDRWRRTMTAAATSELCLEQGLHDEKCNTCGVLFQPLPISHFPGNMWAAKCDYVNALLSPDEFHARHPVIDEWIREQSSLGLWQKYSGLFPLEAHYVGRDRYEAEHWLGSHPNMQPCDVSQEANMDHWLEEDRDFHEFNVKKAPRHKITADWKWYQYTSHAEVLANYTQRSRDFFLLRGLIYKSIAFYGRVPDRTSWIWEWFPDGHVWLSALEEEGDALHVIQSVANLTGTAEIHYPFSLLEWVRSDSRRLTLPQNWWWGW